jgi:hypothetical protein
MSDDQTIESSETIEPHLKIFRDRSILVNESEGETIFREGPPSQETKIRNKKIKHELSNGFLDKLIAECRTGKISWNITPEQEQSFIKLVSSVTSEQSRALLAITILQLCIKAIEPKANMRLHKGGHADFSWINGVSMRGLDSEFIQPTLRKTDLLKYNIYGAMMTRNIHTPISIKLLYVAQSNLGCN